MNIRQQELNKTSFCQLSLVYEVSRDRSRKKISIVEIEVQLIIKKFCDFFEEMFEFISFKEKKFHFSKIYAEL